MKATQQAPTSATVSPAAPQRKSFTRLGVAAHVNAARKAAKEAGFTVTSHPMLVKAVDQTRENARVFIAIKVQANAWAITYHLPYYEEPEMPEGPRTPRGFRDYITAHPTPC